MRTAEQDGEDRRTRRRRRRDVEEKRGERDGATDVRLPVLVFPTELVFYSRQKSSHRRVLTLYNPYSFPLHFNLLCTVPSLYSVADAEGTVRSRSCVDIVVRQRDVSRQQVGRRNRFRLDVWGAGGRRGSRQLWAELQEGEEVEPGLRIIPRPATRTLSRPAPERSRAHSALYVLAAVVCVAVLMLPLRDQPSLVVPPHTHVTVMQKLVCAYVLGLLTVTFLR